MRFQFVITLLIFSIAIVGCESTAQTVENNEAASETEQVTEQEATENIEEAPIEADDESKAVDEEKQSSIIIETVDAKTKAKPASSKRPKLVFQGKKHDYGMIEQGDKVNHVFKFTNTGEADLIIKNAEASCGCTVPTYPFIPIAPGKTGSIAVTFSSVGKMGTQRPSITVTSNAYPRTQTLYLEGFVTDQIAKKESLVEENVQMLPEGSVTKGGDIEVNEKEDNKEEDQ